VVLILCPLEVTEVLGGHGDYFTTGDTEDIEDCTEDFIEKG
jgi:hypothetical protein